VVFALPDSAAVLDPATGAPIGASELLGRLAGADLVLLGELHDNAVHHKLRGALITALAPRHPALVFEQFAETSEPIPPPAAGEDLEGWLDGHGFDRKSWNWPLHEPVVEAALEHGRSLWGSGLSREVLRSVVREGESAAPEHLRPLLQQAPLDSATRAVIDHELIEGHCGKLPATMIPGMRAAQEVRDAVMALALIQASASGPAWLIAGNGHVRRDIGVPRLLRAVAPAASVIAVGLLEREEDGTAPGQDARQEYDLVIVTSRAARTDPCATL
jgi:uncharacterized iron-regulated protein